MSRPFLTARWEDLVILNFDCPEELLTPLVPGGTELDPWEGSHIVSLVGFRFVDTRLRGLAIPGHRTFEEVNLRFYVRAYGRDGDLRRGVVFIRELVPRRAIALVARIVYNEPYLAVPMEHYILKGLDGGGVTDYKWTHRREQYHLFAQFEGPPSDLVPGSEGEFITEHFWGYTAQRDGSTLEYRVDHPPWRIWTPSTFHYRPPPGPTLYGPAFSEVLAQTARSAFVAEGSEVAVYPGQELTT